MECIAEVEETQGSVAGDAVDEHGDTSPWRCVDVAASRYECVCMLRVPFVCGVRAEAERHAGTYLSMTVQPGFSEAIPQRLEPLAIIGIFVQSNMILIASP